MKHRIFAALVCLCLLFGGAPAARAEQAPLTAGDATPIHDRAGLEAIAQNPEGSYVLMNHIDMGDAPWMPIPFNGTFEGGGYTLYNLTIRNTDPTLATSVDGNRKQYDTAFAALFSRAQNAVIQNLTLLGVDVEIRTDQNAFAAGLVGWADNTRISGCRVEGRVTLYSSNYMCGVAGLAGFGYGTADGCSTDVTLVLVDENQDIKCEEFLGGVLATGYMDVEGCDITVRGYASVYGYVHNGGVIGMYYVHTDDANHAGYLRNTTTDAVIHFFEANEDRRAYCAPFIGEQLHWPIEESGNTTRRFENNETTDYTKTLLPEQCEAPVYTEAVTAPACDSFGFTAHTCGTCGYSYRDSYTAPAHQPGEWETVREATAAQNGLRARACLLCGTALEQEEFTAVTALHFAKSSLTLKPGESARLDVQAQPGDAAGAALEYASSDEAVATVDASGTVTAVDTGSATITCTAAGGVQAQCSVKVGGGLSPWPFVIGGAALVLLVAVVLAVAAAAQRKKRRAARRGRAQQRAADEQKRTYYRR